LDLLRTADGWAINASGLLERARGPHRHEHRLKRRIALHEQTTAAQVSMQRLTRRL
jgi:hypothetical protein